VVSTRRHVVDRFDRAKGTRPLQKKTKFQQLPKNNPLPFSAQQRPRVPRQQIRQDMRSVIQFIQAADGSSNDFLDVNVNVKINRSDKAKLADGRIVEVDSDELEGEVYFETDPYQLEGEDKIFVDVYAKTVKGDFYDTGTLVDSSNSQVGYKSNPITTRTCKVRTHWKFGHVALATRLLRTDVWAVLRSKFKNHQL